MTLSGFIRAVLTAAAIVAMTAGGGHAQTTAPTTPNTPAPGGSNDRVVWYVVGAAAAAVLGWIIKTQLFPGSDSGQPPSSSPPPPPEPPFPDQPRFTQPNSPASGRGRIADNARLPPLRRGFDLPPAGETRFVPDEVIVDIPATVPAATIDRIAAQLSLTRLESSNLVLLRRTWHRWRIGGGASVPETIGNLAKERLIAGAGANYLYKLAQAPSQTLNAEQYSPQKLKLPEAHRFATGNRVLVAVIDSTVDADHPDIAGAVAANFNALLSRPAPPHAHGTGMAGAIVARRTMLGIAPNVQLLTVGAFNPTSSSAEGTTFAIVKGLDWAVAQGARVINMSFAGPSDPRLRDALSKAGKNNIVLVAAAGNAGPKSPPLFPAADPNVIAVTATDPDDKVFKHANRGDHIAVAAPGVEIFAPGPDGTFQFTTGTSVAAAEVSGIVALLIERNPKLTPAAIRRILMSTATDLGPKGRDRDFGAGLVNALKAVTSMTGH